MALRTTVAIRSCLGRLGRTNMTSGVIRSRFGTVSEQKSVKTVGQKAVLLRNCTPTTSVLGKRFFCSTGSSSFEVQDYDDFKSRVLQSDKIVIVDFYADWCGPCKLLGPRLESMVDGHNGEILLAKCNVDDLGDVAAEYHVSSIPHVVGIRNGQVVDQFVGLAEDESIRVFIDKLQK